MQFFKHTHIDFLGKRKMFYVVSIVVTLLGLVAAFVRGVEFGIDFEGGAEIDVRFTEQVDLGQVRSAVEQAGFEGAEVKSGGDRDAIIRVKNPNDEAFSAGTTKEMTESLTTALESSFGDKKFEIREINTIGPKIGKELRTKAIWAILVSIIAIMIYIWVRFEFLYGLGAVIALVHDVLVAFAFAVLFNGVFGLNLEMNQSLLAAFLTVVGFSINDTVIIFDRIRENKTLHRAENLMMLVNRSINETLPRTINTSLTVVLVLVVLMLLSGDILQGFAFTMLIGILTGTYSSIYIASSFVIDMMIRQKKLDPQAERDFGTHVVEERERRAAERFPAKAQV